MRFGIDGTAAVTGGGITYLLNLLPALAEIDVENEYWVFLSSHQTQVDLSLPPHFHIKRVSFLKPAVVWRILWQQVILPVWLRRNRIDVLLAPADIAPLLAPCPTVLAIRNPNPYWGPPASTLSGRVRESFLRFLTSISSKHASCVFFVSDSSRHAVTRRLGLDLKKTVVIYHGLGEVFTKQNEYCSWPEKLGVRSPYILSVSAIRIHKDQATLIKAYSSLVRRIGIRHSLVLAGPVVDQPYYRKLQSMIEYEGLQERVQFLGEVTYVQLPNLYRHADLFVLPSLAETFGHPLVEAMESGVPIITTDLPVPREICQDAAWYFKPRNAPELAEKMQVLLENGAARFTLRQFGLARAKYFSWHRTAIATLAVLKRSARVFNNGT